MKTPIYDFVRKYGEKSLRFHVPGHTGKTFLGFEPLDITEVSGADELYRADGIIGESEQIASRIFGYPTYYSAEGSSLCIRAMLYLAAKRSPSGRPPTVVAARNAHRSFLSAAALLGLGVKWICSDSYLSCTVTAEAAEAAIGSCEYPPAALYITSPDYIGAVSPVAGLAAVCKKRGVPLIVDNAHGAYLKFYNGLPYPMDEGADMCCDSAHKTLPVLTGGAYLHTSGCFSASEVKSAMALFSSSSPSYLILSSLDLANAYLAGGYTQKLKKAVENAAELKRALSDHGFELCGDEPLKTVIKPKSFGYTGTELANILREGGVEPEFADPDHTVLMPSAETSPEEFGAVRRILENVPEKTPVSVLPPAFHLPEKATEIREAALSPSEILPLRLCSGRILSGVNASCPPAVPVAVCGEIIDKAVINVMEYYGIKECEVIK